MALPKPLSRDKKFASSLAQILATDGTIDKLEKACAIMLVLRYIKDDEQNPFLRATSFAPEKHLLIELAKKTMHISKANLLHLHKVHNELYPNSTILPNTNNENVVLGSFPQSLQNVIQQSMQILHDKGKDSKINNKFKSVTLDCLNLFTDGPINPQFSDLEFQKIAQKQLGANSLYLSPGCMSKLREDLEKTNLAITSATAPSTPPTSSSTSSSSNSPDTQTANLESLITSFLADTKSAVPYFFVIQDSLFVYDPDSSEINKLNALDDKLFAIHVNSIIKDQVKMDFLLNDLIKDNNGVAKFNILSKQGFNPSCQQLSKILGANNPIRKFYIDQFKFNNVQEDAIKYFLAAILKNNIISDINRKILSSIALLVDSITSLIDKQGDLDEKPWFRSSARTYFNLAKDNLWQIPPKLLFGLITFIVQTKLFSQPGKSFIDHDTKAIELQTVSSSKVSITPTNTLEISQSKEMDLYVNMIFSLAIDNYLDKNNDNFASIHPSFAQELEEKIKSKELSDNNSRKITLLLYKIFRLTNPNDNSSSSYQANIMLIKTTALTIPDLDEQKSFIKQLAKFDNDLCTDIVEQLPKIDATPPNQTQSTNDYIPGSNVVHF